MMVAVSGKYFRAGRIVVPAMLVALCAVALWADSAQARFTCSTNQDCAAKANQCDPGRTPCNDGICNPNAPGADSIGCILIPNDDKCDDGSFCNGTQVCDPNHGCKDPVIPDCDDDIPCTNDFCNEEANECSNVPRNERCSDGQYCDGVEICDPEDGCKAGPPPNCNDNTVCTTDTCDEATDSCKHTQNNGSCSNGLYCDGVETCSPTGCKPGTPPNCADSTSCTIDTCDEATDSCKRTPNNASCSNGQFCDGVEVCSPTLGCRPGTPPNCNDNIVCTTDACVEATDSCSHVVNNANCNNGKFCDGVEVCSPTLGCRPGTPPNCNDNFPCTQDVCVEANDTCAHSPFNSLCNNNKFCDGVEVCSPTQGCQAGPPPDCGDSIECTDDRCIEATDSCQHVENNAACNNGLFCDGVEQCQALIGCYAGPPPNCSDNVDCTVDVCVEETDTCSHAAVNNNCANGRICDGTEICDPIAGCQAGTPLVCTDAIPCTSNTCVEPQGCVVTPNNTVCTNGLFCDGTEVCNPGVGCQSGTPPNCADALTCTNDACVEASDTCSHVPNGLLCGNGVIDPNCGEECDDPNPGEICNDFIDNDGDMLIDCADPDCAEVVTVTCDDECQLVPPCAPLQRDPAVISFGGAEEAERSAGEPGTFSFHGRLVPLTPIDPLKDGFSVTLSNANGEIFRADLSAYDLSAAGSRYRYKASDPDAVAQSGGGVLMLSIRRRMYGGEMGYGLRVRTTGDFSRATLARMTTQVYFGDDVGYVTATWQGEPGRWVLRQRDLDDPTP